MDRPPTTRAGGLAPDLGDHGAGRKRGLGRPFLPNLAETRLTPAQQVVRRHPADRRDRDVRQISSEPRRIPAPQTTRPAAGDDRVAGRTRARTSTPWRAALGTFRERACGQIVDRPGIRQYSW